MAKLNLNSVGTIKLVGRVASTVPTPPSGNIAVFLDSDNNTVCYKNSSGSVFSNMRINVLASDVTNDNVVPNTIADVTGLSFPVVSGQRYNFKFVIPYTAAASTTGSRWCINGPTFSFLQIRTITTLSGGGISATVSSDYDNPTTSSASSVVAGSLATIEGVIVATANGDVIARFASEITLSAITAKAGAYVEWQQY